MNRGFARFARKSGITDTNLCSVARAIRLGRADADLGGGIYKQRMARKGAGKSSGFRTILIFQFGGHCVFVYGFAKKDRPNLTERELNEFRLVAKQVLR